MHIVGTGVLDCPPRCILFYVSNNIDSVSNCRVIFFNCYNSQIVS